MSVQKINYTKEYKSEAVKLALDSASISQAAKNLGIPTATLYTWVGKAKKAGITSVQSNDGTLNHINTLEILEENKLLKQKLKRLEQEKAILKKAATYFAQELE